MAKEAAGTPRFVRRDIVVISLLDEEGKPKNELAAIALAYHAQKAVVAGFYSIKGRTVYSVEIDDGAVLHLTEDCLMLAKSRD